MRSKSVRQLHAILSRWTSISHIHCYGLEEAGVLEAIEEELAILHEEDPSSMYVIINCYLANGSLKLLVDEIIRALKLSRYGKIDSVDALASILETNLFTTPAFVVVSSVSCQTLLSLPKLMSILCCHTREEPLIRFVTHSELPWDRIGVLSTFSAPVSIGFENLSEEECVDLLAGIVVKDGIDRKVRIACDKYSEKYGDVGRIRNMKLLPVLDAMDETDCFWEDENARDAPINLPLSAKYLLVASFCASHNPPATDRRYFVKFHGREKRSEFRERRAEQAAEQRDIEAKAADLQRIKCIYFTLTVLYPTEDIHMDIDVNSQIASLCDCGLLARTTSAANLDQARFRCMLSFENVNEIA
ncbi:hypothetical protein KIN20_002532, partial [Parelaphostrongylus tenuis]